MGTPAGRGSKLDLLHGTPGVEDAGGDGAGVALPPDEERALNRLRMAEDFAQELDRLLLRRDDVGADLCLMESSSGAARKEVR